MNTASSPTAVGSRAPIVIKIGGVALEQQRASPALWTRLVALHRSHPGGLVLVHGGGKAVDRLLTQLGMETKRHQGLRITPSEQMDVIAGVLAGTLNKTLVGCINAAGGKGVGLCLGDGDALRCAQLHVDGADLGCVGEVTGGGAALLRTLLAERYVPVIACVGLDARGTLLNVNGDDAAAGVAKALGAQALVLLTDVAGVLDAQKRLIAELSHAEIAKLSQQGVITGGMIPKLQAAAATAKHLGAPVTIMSGAVTSDLERWASGEAVGTRILSA
jgi:acetylglutamate kinase